MSKKIPYFIVNPQAGGGRTRKLWGDLSAQIESIWGKCNFVFTQKEGDAVRHARLACEKKQEVIVAVGGDGTLHEVVNGILQAGLSCAKEVSLGIISMGSGDDFIKTLSLPKDPLQALKVIQQRKSKKIDVVQVDFMGHKHKKESRYFINLADFGLGGRVMQKVNASKKVFGSQLTYLFHALSTLVTFSPFSVVIEGQDQNFHFHKMILGLVANGKYFGSGMCVAPEAKLEDGLMDVIMVEKMGIMEFIRIIPQVYRGEKIQNSNIFRFKAKKFYVQPTSSKPVFIELDGEQPGSLPASFEVLPQAIHVFV